MIKNLFYLLIFGSTLIQNINAQIKITSKIIIAQNDTIEFGYPVFSNSGNKILFTTLDYSNIYKLKLNTQKVSQLVDGELLGFGFSISDDDKYVAYRKTTWNGNNRIQENFITNLENQKSTLVEFGEELELPNFKLLSTKIKKELNITGLTSNEVILKGIVDERIQIYQNGKTKTVDPIKDGRYIWPKLSPNKKLLVAYELSEGIIIFDLNGKIIQKLGYYDSPSWTKDGKWIICHKESDSDKEIIKSELYALSIDGNKKIQLTNSTEIELFPETSKTQNQIVCHTKEGKIILFDYEIEE
ncbi:MAG: hypothetical protein O3A55_04220 [Bacteroidetes bacterium]|nr:hypothetical protein [Bacteroidota bacterium]